MSKELVIGSNRHETKVAILEEDQLVEVYFQRANEYSLAGSIHKGRVTRVLPGMQSAFVDLGLERDTFLYVSDFFEENEDIDTLEEKPVRNERRDRERTGGRGERPVYEKSFAPREPIVVPTEAAEPESAVPGEENGLLSQSVGKETNPEAGEPRNNERPEGRDFRGGDRRNRRSRRRRQRGNGFPENKYAPASAVTGAPEPVHTIEEPVEDSGDVIILPGESLAKYRRTAGSERPTGQGNRDPEQDDRALPTPEEQEEYLITSEVPAGVPTDPAEQEAIEREAEELELSEKVFAHHDDESVDEIEEKFEEVKQDQPAPSVITNGEEPSELASSEGEEYHASSEQFLSEGLSNEDIGVHLHSGAERKLAAASPGELNESFDAASEGPDGEPVDVDEFDGVDADETSGDAEESVIAAESGEGTVSAETGQAQTATLREQGGRYLHRASRRMRRRRGGNRFSQPANPPASVTGSVAGAAAALEPEPIKRESVEERSAEKPERVMPSIADLLKAGQEIIVQIAKEPLGQKGARITSHVALPGRYVVFMPSVSHLGVSRRIASDEERQRLKRILQTHREGTTGGFIVRTAGEGVPEEEIAADMSFLYSLWLDIRQKAEKKPAPALLHYDLDIVQRILRDQVTDEFKAIWVDNEDMYENVVTFMQRFQPALVNRVKMYTRSAPIFDAFNITQELEKALRPKVWLKSGGYIVINQTEALVAIDINTGKYVGKSNRLEDTIVKTNTEAVKEIVRQIRLRDLGGIIVVDFIDMDERKNRQKVMQALEEAMRADKAPNKILQFNDFGLVAITRKRVKQSLERTLCSPCPYCEGAGYVKSVQTIIGEILVEAQKIARAIEGKDVVLRVHPEVAKVLKARDNQFLEELEEILARPVLVTGDATLHHEKFDLA